MMPPTNPYESPANVAGRQRRRSWQYVGIVTALMVLMIPTSLAAAAIVATMVYVAVTQLDGLQAAPLVAGGVGFLAAGWVMYRFLRTISIIVNHRSTVVSKEGASP